MTTADVWQVFRQRAVAKWMTIAEYDKLVELNPQEDIEMDEDFKKIVENCPWDIIVSWRMGFHLLPNVTSIWLDVSPEEWAQRIFLDYRWKQEKKYTTVEEALQANHDRMEEFKQRFLKLYGVDFTDTAYYTKIIDTTGKTFDENLKQLDNYITSLRNI